MTHVYWLEHFPKQYEIFLLELLEDDKSNYEFREERYGCCLVLLEDGSYKDFNTDWTK